MNMGIVWIWGAYHIYVDLKHLTLYSIYIRFEGGTGNVSRM